jgi:hypothetical protein
MKRFAILLAAAALMGCEGAVLVNNRPERTAPGMESPTPAEQTQQASDTTAADMNVDRAQTAGATTQPADQTVETTNTRIESQSN